MEVEIRVEAEFWTQAKRLSKKYHSMKKDLQEFKKSLIGNPYQGSSLGRGVRKVRMAIASKGKGKSGGARVITYVKVVSKTIFLVEVYLKSEYTSVDEVAIIAKLSTLDLL